MNFKKTDFSGLIVISHDIYVDKRGSFRETFRKDELEKILKYEIDFCQENVVHSYKNVLRGLHYQKEPYSQSKLVSVNHGEILDIAVDLRKKSKTYGKYFSYFLSETKYESLFIPRGFAHGYLTISETAKINYRVDNYYNPRYESGISYNDDFLNIDWKGDEMDFIISEKDKNLSSHSW